MTTTAPGASEPIQTGLAAENERLRLRVAALERELAEGREQQTATAEILRVIARNPSDLRAVFRTIGENAMRLCAGAAAAVYLTDGTRFWPTVRVGATHENHGGWGAQLAAPKWAVPLGSYNVNVTADQAIQTGRTQHEPDLLADPELSTRMRVSADSGWRAALAAPLRRGADTVGAISVLRFQPGPFTTEQVSLLERFADQAVIAIENARLFTELQESNTTLKEALEQQTATAEVLRAIASAPADLDRVLQIILETAARLCGAPEAFMRVVDGDSLRVGAALGPGSTEFMRRSRTTPLAQAAARADQTGMALRRGHAVRFDTLESDPELGESARENCRRAGLVSMMAVPLLQQGNPVGTIIMGRTEFAPFSDAEVALVETFASQAAIAIENARLFSELRERDERRRAELERASAIQQRLLPSSVEGWPGALEVAVRFRPAVETSGDFYDLLRLTPPVEGALPPLQIAVGDVAGKGMSAALVTALARSALQLSATVPTGMATPAATLRVAGQRLHRDVGSGHFVACALGVVEPPGLLNAGPLLRLSNAAQVPVLLVRGGTASEVEAPGDRLPLGARPDGAYKDAEVELLPGDVVVFSSDGLVEAPSLPGAATPEHLDPPARVGELFGFERLQRSAEHWSTAAESAEAVAAGLWADLTAWCGEESHHDDVTLLVLRVP